MSVLAGLVGLVVGFVARKATPWFSGVKDETGIRIPWPEALGFVLFALAGWHVETLFFGALLLAVLTADFRYKLIPDKVTFPGTIVGILASSVWPAFITTHFRQDVLSKVIGVPGGFPLALAGAAAGFAVFEVFRRVMSRIASMEVMGMGDSKLVMMMGAFLGPAGVLLSLFPGMLCGIVIGVAYTRVMKSPHFPFGPALGLGGFITLLWPDAVGEGFAWIQGLGRRFDRGALLLVYLLLLAVVVVLMMRVRKRSKEYTDAIEEDYSKLEEREKKKGK